MQRPLWQLPVQPIIQNFLGPFDFKLPLITRSVSRVRTTPVYSQGHPGLRCAGAFGVLRQMFWCVGYQLPMMRATNRSAAIVVYLPTLYAMMYPQI
eukprot:6176962-Pleurochrysis_carterae.AAC.2